MGLNLVGIDRVSTDQISEDPPFQRHPSRSIIPGHKDQILYGGLPGRSRAPTLNSNLNIQVPEDTCSGL